MAKTIYSLIIIKKKITGKLPGVLPVIPLANTQKRKN